MKTSNKFLTYSFLGILVLTTLFAIALRINNTSNINVHAAQSGQNVTNSSNQESNSPFLASAQTNFAFNTFDKIETSGNWEILITQGSQYQVKVLADSKEISGVTVEQNGDVLSFSMQNNWFGNSNKRIRAEVVLPTLEKIDASGSSKVYFSGFKGNKMSIELSGSSYLTSQQNNFTNMNLDASGASKINMESDNFADLDVDLSGSSYLDAKGSKITNLSLDAEGASDVDLGESQVVNAKVDLSGASKLKINMTGGNLMGKAEGASDVVYSGSVNSQEISTSGGSNITKN